jgi:hypothetical protein
VAKATAVAGAATLDAALSAAHQHDAGSASAAVQTLWIGGLTEFIRSQQGAPERATLASDLLRRTLRQHDAYVASGLISPEPGIREKIQKRLAALPQ